MSYITQLKKLELDGINYHRLVANFLLSKLNELYSCNSASVLVYGDKDLLISYLLSEFQLIHVADTGFSEPVNTHRIKKVELDTFPLEEYDIIIGLFTDMKFIKQAINSGTHFFVIPEDNFDLSLNISVEHYLDSRKIKFEKTIFSSSMNVFTAFHNL